MQSASESQTRSGNRKRIPKFRRLAHVKAARFVARR
jgi:hypothetical protein